MYNYENPALKAHLSLQVEFTNRQADNDLLLASHKSTEWFSMQNTVFNNFVRGYQKSVQSFYDYN
jgi:hypothetical protein